MTTTWRTFCDIITKCNLYCAHSGWWLWNKYSEKFHSSSTYFHRSLDLSFCSSLLIRNWKKLYLFTEHQVIYQDDDAGKLCDMISRIKVINTFNSPNLSSLVRATKIPSLCKLQAWTRNSLALYLSTRIHSFILHNGHFVLFDRHLSISLKSQSRRKPFCPISVSFLYIPCLSDFVHYLSFCIWLILLIVIA